MDKDFTAASPEGRTSSADNSKPSNAQILTPAVDMLFASTIAAAATAEVADKVAAPSRSSDPVLDSDCIALSASATEDAASESPVTASGSSQTAISTCTSGYVAATADAEDADAAEDCYPGSEMLQQTDTGPSTSATWKDADVGSAKQIQPVPGCSIVNVQVSGAEATISSAAIASTATLVAPVSQDSGITLQTHATALPSLSLHQDAHAVTGT